jgi:hypothetical protein
MKTEHDETLRAEAVRKLRNYLASGLEGFRQQALDRLRELGIDTAGCETRSGCERLLGQLLAGTEPRR